MNIHLFSDSSISIRNSERNLDDENSPSTITCEYICWRKNNRLHREDGPAIIYTNPYYKEEFPEGRFFLNDMEYNKKDYLKKLELMKDENQPVP